MIECTKINYKRGAYIRMKNNKNHFRGCLLGGAIGDALGYPVEFLPLYKIRNQYGQNGITCLQKNNNDNYEITDDTQMTILTAEGLIKNLISTNGNREILSIEEIYKSYQIWGHTQNVVNKDKIDHSSYLLNYPPLLEDRAAGRTCLSAIKSNKLATLNNPINDSKGCGAVMRMAPVGLVYTKDKAFKFGCECGVITHGHPSGYISAGILGCVISVIIEGHELIDAVNYSLDEAKKYKGHEECVELIEMAVNLSNSKLLCEDAIYKLGQGWTGEEAIAISVYCALKYKDDFEKALITSFNHDGDSDSVGAITGNILGAYLGIDKIPYLWIKNLELNTLLIELADKLLTK